MWELPAAPWEPGWGCPCQCGWIKQASLSPFGRPEQGVPGCFQGWAVACTHRTTRCALHCTPWSSVSTWSFALCGGDGEALG